MQATKAAVAEFHRLFNEGKYHEIYVAAGPALKGSTSESAFTAYLSAAKTKWGACNSSTTFDATIGDPTAMKGIELNYRSDFQNASVVEHFTFSVVDHQPFLSGYTASSKVP